MKREILQTGDGSNTIFLPDWNESYHSKHGALQEAYHVFVDNGLSLFDQSSISILEIGFGTALNAFITWLEHTKRNQSIYYVGVEAYPVSIQEVALMQYPKALQVPEYQSVFDQIHAIAWEIPTAISEHFTLTKRQQFFQDITDEDRFDLIYFDAFGFRVQPELWDVLIFKRMYTALRKGGVLVTYACRTSIKKAMLEVGFEVEKLPGAPGKREMLRAFKK